ncbi:MAG: N-acetylmuramoyl-L-alanine amidase (EC [uncultured Sulfurovum sp.]|uniref:N-acetylmuramoyl-L-alanine amidase n=1 Tax=uncultured Sulfurovum sp. TaxID=269237 RepID=A0A6S6T525_9BACT|nr:MAG: N-acetylmuramoyl-L-alanine amidase (EC [uncultured Sulfurovum sp.]
MRLYFTSDIQRVTSFTLPAKEEGAIKYVFDIHGAVLPQGKGISQHSFRTIDSFRMGQNSPDKLRVVIVSKEKNLNKKHSYEAKVLAIPLINGQKSTIGMVTRTSSIMSSIYSRINKKYTVVIDAGHGGRDGGASCCGNKKEKKVVLSVAKKLKSKLEDKGYKVYMTRTSDSFVKLPKRTAFANKKKADIFVSIHANAAPKKSLRKVFKGIEIYYLSPAKTQRAKEAAAKENSVMFEDKDYYTKNAYLSLISREKIVESHKLGIDVSNHMLKSVRQHYGAVEDGGVKTANFWVLVGAQMPAILVETGYITHPREGKNLMNGYYRSLLADGIANGIERYLKNKK